MVAEGSKKTPSTNGTRKKPGTFAKGNPGGPGNPLAKQVAQLRASLVNAVSREDIQRIAKGLIRKARKGDVSAAHEVFDRVLGKATQAVEVTKTVRGKTKVTHTFDHGRFAELFRAHVRGDGGNGQPSAADNRN